MIFRILPCIDKSHGSIKYLKYLISVSRQKGSNVKPPSAKVLASPSSPIPQSPPELDDKNIPIRKRKKSSDYPYIISSHNQPKSSLEKDILHDEGQLKDIHSHLKPIAQPDVIVSPSEPITNAEKEKEQVKLLNAVRPADLDWHKQAIDLRLLPKHYKSLSKFRLTGLVVLTTLAGYGMAPGIFEPTTLACMALGTALTSAAANTINQVLEVPYDSQMARTKCRVLIRGVLTPLHASMFAISCASIGLTTLYLGTNTLTAILGATNLILYTIVYTPMKRYSIANTWLGSIVGAIPPLMGWAACTGTLNSGALLMAAILYSWQFPHFNALSWNLRPDYSRAGYRMTSVINPQLCKRVALRHSVSLLVLCSAAPLLDLTTWTFAFDSFPLNCYLIYCAYNFYKKGDSQSSRKLFRLSLVHLPALMFLMLVGKKYANEDAKQEKKS
ncbi:hypothetical protein JTE90_011592 [Oedothorax gibbosus]|uniref:Protoheme IX farnesyltransferase, mitochondrial n=1 Tax=Oedothorax gibbosus TaxID=931172 RepID=A0AAV6U603_9ARAC|nr:hypothetical protein JTE90_011592 [Oedothorax gibbosus]